MESENKNAYSEVIEILKTIDDEKRLEVLPIEMLELLKSKANPEYEPNIEIDKPLDEQDLQPETLSILSWIAFKYWNDEIDTETQEQKEETINDNIDESNKNLPVLYTDYKWYKKLKIKIIEFFRKFLGMNKKEEEGINE